MSCLALHPHHNFKPRRQQQCSYTTTYWHTHPILINCTLAFMQTHAVPPICMTG